MAKKKLIAGNWKMNGSVEANDALVRAVIAGLPGAACTVAVCVPAPYLAQLQMLRHGSALELGAQDVSRHEQGAYTGEVSAAMLSEVGVDGVVLGHSERRELFGETDKALQRKVPAALEAGLVPILCVGETEAERENGDTERKLRHQVQEGLEKVPDERLHEVVIAYEPIWAIGTGRVATPETAQEAIGFIRALVGDRSREAAERVRVLYGGSVKPGNAAELLGQPDIDGALVGGASLDPDGLVEIVKAAAAL